MPYRDESRAWVHDVRADRDAKVMIGALFALQVIMLGALLWL